MSETAAPPTPRTPTVYFIDDSATMREVIKIAFRRENINVITCHDAASALAQFEQTSPDAVISDVIMPDKDGYEVCQFIKQHPQWNATPVILLSGVVNRSVAEKAMAVKADELVRKPFQPQELIARVKSLLYPKGDAPGSDGARPDAQALSSLFGAGAAPPASGPAAAAAGPAEPMTEVLSPSPARPAPSPGGAARVDASVSMELQRLRSEIVRLEYLVKKLQSELDAERQYGRALEAHIKTLRDSG